MDADTGAVAPARSIADDLREIREGLKRERKPKDVPLPGYGDKLIARYRVLDIDEIDEIGEKVAGERQADEDTDMALNAMRDTLIVACVGFYTKVDGQLIPLEQVEPGMEGGPIRWGDPRLAKSVGYEVGESYGAREILDEVLADKALILRHHNRVTNWMERAREKVEADFE